MKLDKIKFAELVSWFGHRMKSAMTNSEIEWLDNYIDIELPEASVISAEALHTLMGLMQEGTKKIEAIKQHRSMTGYGLKESKDIVEGYWTGKPKLNTEDHLYKLLKAGKATAADQQEAAAWLIRLHS